ncbi:hypothetical protein ACP4OV_015494 [Aristida adscensionis]
MYLKPPSQRVCPSESKREKRPSDRVVERLVFATMIAKSRVIAALFLIMFAGFAAGDSDELPASFDILQQ